MRCAGCGVEFVAWVDPEGSLSGYDHPEPTCSVVRRRVWAEVLVLGLIGGFFAGVFLVQVLVAQ